LGVEEHTNSTGFVPRGLSDNQTKLEAGVYEPSNSSYRSRWFCVIKKDGKSLRIVHSLEPLNEVTIAHSGVPPATERWQRNLPGELVEACLIYTSDMTNERWQKVPGI